LGIATASRGADHLRSRPALDILRLPDDLRRKVYGAETKPDPTAYDNKAPMVAWGDDMFAVGFRRHLSFHYPRIQQSQPAGLLMKAGKKY